MTDINTASHDNEIDLLNILSIIRPALIPAIIVALLLGMATFLAARTLDREYTATARFAIADRSSEGQNKFSASGVLSAFVPGGNKESERAADKIMSRDFIMALFEETGIDEDPFFTKDGDSAGPLATLQALAFGPPETPTFAQTINRIVGAYREAVTVVVNNNAVIDLTVTHPEPERAAILANQIVQAHLDNIDEGIFENDQRQVTLMESRLVAAQRKLDLAMRAARDFAVENSVRSREELNANSLRLDHFRREAERLDQVLAGLTILREARSAAAARLDLRPLVSQYPIALTILQREFGWDARESNVPVPAMSRIEQLYEDFEEELRQLRQAVRTLESEAEQSASAAGRLAELEREITVRQAVYSALVNQVEATSLGAALNDTRGEWIQRAASPPGPSAPRKALMAAIAMILGFLAFMGWHLAITIRRGTLYSTSAFTDLLGVPPAAEISSRLLGRRKKYLPAEIVEFVYALHVAGNRRILVLGAPGPSLAQTLATVVAEGIANNDLSIAVLDLYRKTDTETLSTIRSTGTLENVRENGYVTVLRWIEQGPLKGQTDLASALDDLANRFDKLVIVGTNINSGILQNMIALEKADRAILVFRKGITRKNSVERIRKMISKNPKIERSMILM